MMNYRTPIVSDTGHPSNYREDIQTTNNDVNQKCAVYDELSDTPEVQRYRAPKQL
jgi:hypothetical protein